MDPIVLLIATFDTKGVESDYIKQRVQANGARCVTVDVGVGGTPTAEPDVSLRDLCQGSEYTVEQVRAMLSGLAPLFTPRCFVFRRLENPSSRSA